MARHAGRLRRHRRRGFTLLETMLTLMIVAVGVASVFDAYTSFVTTNTWSTHSATGTFLASEIRELTRDLPKHDPVTGFEVDNFGTIIGWGIEPGELTARDFDDLDDFDGVIFAYDGTPISPDANLLDGARLPGPIDAVGDPIEDFSVFELDEQGEVTSAWGWAQMVEVEKVDPFDYTRTIPDDSQVARTQDSPGRAVDEYPLRVTVTVLYLDPRQDDPQEIAVVSWVVP